MHTHRRVLHSYKQGSMGAAPGRGPLLFQGLGYLFSQPRFPVQTKGTFELPSVLDRGERQRPRWHFGELARGCVLPG